MGAALPPCNLYNAALKLDKNGLPDLVECDKARLLTGITLFAIITM